MCWLKEQGSEGAFCENCFLARNLPTCFACKGEISGAGDLNFHILLFRPSWDGHWRVLHWQNFTLLTLIFYLFSFSAFQMEWRWRVGEASFSHGTLVASLAVFVASRFLNIVNIVNTGWYSTTVFYNFFLTDIKKLINCKTQPFSSSLYIDILIFWCLSIARWNISYH